MPDRTPAEPYTDSGIHAAVQAHARTKAESVLLSLADADQLENHAHMLIARSKRKTVVAAVVLGGAILVSASLLFVCYHAYDGTQDGLIRGNWAMLGVLVSLGGSNFAWAWLSQQRRLREVGLKLLTRAEYQRRRALLEKGKADAVE